MADIHPKTLGYVETGRRSVGIASFARIVQCLGINPSRFFDDLPPVNSKKLKAIAKALARIRK